MYIPKPKIMPTKIIAGNFQLTGGNKNLNNLLTTTIYKDKISKLVYIFKIKYLIVLYLISF